MAVSNYLKKVKVRLTATDTWLILPTKSENLSLTSNLEDISNTKDNLTGRKSMLQSKKDWSLDFELVYASDDAGVQLLRTAIVNRTGLLISYEKSPTDVYQGEGHIENMNLSLTEGTVQTASVSIKSNGELSYSTTPT